MTRSKGRRNSHMDYFPMPSGYFSGSELRRMPTLRSSVNKGKKEGQSPALDPGH
jgi:hypothetical protein